MGGRSKPAPPPPPPQEPTPPPPPPVSAAERATAEEAAGSRRVRRGRGGYGLLSRASIAVPSEMGKAVETLGTKVSKLS